MPELEDARQELFAQKVAKGMSQYEAYKSLYKVKKEGTTRGAASRLAAKVIVAARIEELKKEGAAKALIEIAEVVEGLKRIALADLADAFNQDGKLKTIHEIPKPLRLAINAIEVDELFGQDGPIGYTKKLKLAEKNKAWEMLGRYLKMFTDKTEHDVSERLENILAASWSAE